MYRENFKPFEALTPSKAKFQSCLACPPPLVVFLLSTLAPKWTALTLTQCTQRCVPVSHLYVRGVRVKWRKIYSDAGTNIFFHFMAVWGPPLASQFKKTQYIRMLGPHGKFDVDLFSYFLDARLKDCSQCKVLITLPQGPQNLSTLSFRVVYG